MNSFCGAKVICKPPINRLMGRGVYTVAAFYRAINLVHIDFGAYGVAYPPSCFRLAYEMG